MLTVMFPRQAGKNEVSAALVAALLAGRVDLGGTIILCAPTLTPQALISFERTKRYLAAMDGMGAWPVSIEGATLRIGHASAMFLSASPAAHVAGHTASIALIADEAQDIDADWFNRQFRPMAASTGAPTVLFGTPWDGRTLLERAARPEPPPRRSPCPRQHGPAALAGLVATGGTLAQTLWRLRGGRTRAPRREPPALPDAVRARRRRRARVGLLSPGQFARLEGEHPRERGPRRANATSPDSTLRGRAKAPTVPCSPSPGWA